MKIKSIYIIIFSTFTALFMSGCGGVAIDNVPIHDDYGIIAGSASEIRDTLRRFPLGQKLIIDLTNNITLLSPLVIGENRNVVFRCYNDRISVNSRAAIAGNGCYMSTHVMRRHLVLEANARVKLKRVALTTHATPGFDGYGGITIGDNAHLMMDGGSINNITFHKWPNGNRAYVMEMGQNARFSARATQNLKTTNPFHPQPTVENGIRVTFSHANDQKAHD